VIINSSRHIGSSEITFGLSPRLYVPAPWNLGKVLYDANPAVDEKQAAHSKVELWEKERCASGYDSPGIE